MSGWRPAAGWCARRGAELVDGARAVLAPPPPGVPPRRLRARVGAAGVREYLDGGAAAADQLAAALAPRRFADFAAILDFGCGSGRVLRHIAGRCPEGRLVGVDVDVAAITWGQEHLEDLELRVGGALPPLPCPDAQFELIYSISVFSHLDVTGQDAWLAELARLLAPGGTALVSTHGPSALAAFAGGEVRTAWCVPEAFSRGELGDGEVLSVPYRASRWSAGDLPGVGEGYGLTFHGHDYLRQHWGRYLTVTAILPRAVSGWQDLVVLGG